MPDPSGWTIDTLHEHVRMLMEANDRRYEQRFDASQKAIELGFSAQKAAVDAALAAADRAVIKAETAAEKRFESVNEFRNTLGDQQRNLIPRAEVEVIERSMTDKITALQKQMDALLAERVGGRGAWGYVVGASGLIVAIAALVLRFFSR
jgi:hypothetical protein